jgi:large subunit ribosomal protein L2
MVLVSYPEKTNTRRFASKMEKPKKRFGKRYKTLTKILNKKSGRSHGQMTVRHQGGRHKRYYRMIDFLRNKHGVLAKVEAIEYDPNRNVSIALLGYSDGEKRYILLPKDLKVGDEIVSGEKVEVRVGNAMKLKNLPIGTVVHNVELNPGKGGQLGRSAGTGLTLQSKEAGYAHLKMPSGEIRMISLESLGTVGSLGNEEWKNVKLGKAGRSRHLGIRPSVRGTAMDPHSHAHGGGEGRSGVGRKKPMTKYGRPAVGNTRKKGKWTSKYIIKRRGK